MVIECVDSWLGRLQNGRACFALRHVLSRIFWCRQHRSGSSWLHFGQQSWTPHVPNSSEIRDMPLACIPPAADATWRRAPRDVTTPPPPGERRRTSEQDADVEEFNLAVENVVVVRDVRHIASRAPSHTYRIPGCQHPSERPHSSSPRHFDSFRSCLPLSFIPGTSQPTQWRITIFRALGRDTLRA